MPSRNCAAQPMFKLRCGEWRHDACGELQRQRAWLVASGALILAMCVVILSPVTAGGAGAAGVDPKGAAPVIRGYPVVWLRVPQGRVVRRRHRRHRWRRRPRPRIR